MSLPVYLAPMEGVTDHVYRRVHNAHFTGVSKYFIPFISPTQDLCLTNREKRDISPANNASLYAVPQILTKRADHFLWAAQQLLDMGYSEVNLNVGCPSGTVTGKRKGAGLLLDLPAMESMLDDIFTRAPMKVSIKTRIGFTDPMEFERILELYSRYPVCELIIHPRTRMEYYRGQPHRDTYADALARTQLPLVYNGDLFTPEACRQLERELPSHALMIGRGLLANPALARAYAGGAPITAAELAAYVDDLTRAYAEVHPGNVVLGRMREVLKNIVCCFEDAEKPRKAIRKAASLPALEEAAARLFGEFALRSNPGFVPENRHIHSTTSY